MLWRRSASLTSTTRRSEIIASSILRNVSACSSTRETYENLPIFVRPSTSSATSAPNCWAIDSLVVSVSSRTSWSRPTTIETSSALRSARIEATFKGWTRYGSPERRTWPLCSRAEKT